MEVGEKNEGRALWTGDAAKLPVPAFAEMSCLPGWLDCSPGMAAMCKWGRVTQKPQRNPSLGQKEPQSRIKNARVGHGDTWWALILPISRPWARDKPSTNPQDFSQRAMGVRSIGVGKAWPGKDS